MAQTEAVLPKHEDIAQDEVNKARQQLKSLRESLVKRVVQRVTVEQDWTPDLRAHPDQYPPLDASKVQWELMVARLMVTYLLEPTTTLPIDAECLHRRLCTGPLGGDYQRFLSLTGMPGPQPLIARLCHQQVLEALQLQLGPRTGGGPRRMWITRLERAALANLVGVVDPMPVEPIMMPSVQQVMAGAMQQMMMGPAGPRPPLGPGPPPFMPPVTMPPLMSGGMMGMGMDGSGTVMDSQGPGGLSSEGTGGGMKRGPDNSNMDLDALLSKKTQRDRMTIASSNTGTELQAVLARPTAREAAKREVFKTADGASAIQEHCPHLTKEDCKRANNSPVACSRVHFKRVIRPHTDVSLGNCSYLNTCRNFNRCKFIHYDIDDEDQLLLGPALMPGALPPGMESFLPGIMGGGGAQANKSAPVPKYLQALKDPQWVCCDIRKLDMKVLGKFGVIMADPPWQIHQDLPYGTMEDEEMRRMDIGCLQDDGVIFLWVTGRAMELGRECLKIWGYDRVDELIWVKTNQLNRLIRTGRTGHWLNHSKEHCLIGYKGKPNLNKYVDCDVVVAEVRETSRKPDEMYPLLERLSPGTRKLEIFARGHNLMPGWIGLGNQLPGVELLEPDVRARYIQRYGPPGPDGKLPPPD